MKDTVLLFILKILIVNFCLGQEPDVLEYKSISINGINRNSTKADLISTFGQPDTLYDPQFECGPYSADQEYVKKVELIKYPGLDLLIVNDKVAFQEINLHILPKDFTVKSDKLDLTKTTSIDDLKAIFPNSYENWTTDKYGIFRLWPCPNCDSEIWIYFENNLMKKIKFWNPC